MTFFKNSFCSIAFCASMIMTNVSFAKDAASEFSASKKIDNTELVLNGVGTRMATIFKVNVYHAGLYLKNKTNDANVVLNAELPKQVELHFVRDVDAKKIQDAWLEAFKANNSNFSDLEKRVAQLNSSMKDLKDGQTLSFTFLKNNSTQVSINQEVLATIEGADFQKGLLSVWLGQNPPNKELKEGLLSTK